MKRQLFVLASNVLIAAFAIYQNVTEKSAEKVAEQLPRVGLKPPVLLCRPCAVTCIRCLCRKGNRLSLTSGLHGAARKSKRRNWLNMPNTKIKWKSTR